MVTSHELQRRGWMSSEMRRGTVNIPFHKQVLSAHRPPLFEFSSVAYQTSFALHINVRVCFPKLPHAVVSAGQQFNAHKLKWAK
jgi:hypothetical protein